MAVRPRDLPVSRRSVVSVLLWIALFLVLLGAPVLLRLAVGDEEPDNAIVHEQERASRTQENMPSEMRRAA